MCNLCYLSLGSHLGFDFPGTWLHVDMAAPAHVVRKKPCSVRQKIKWALSRGYYFFVLIFGGIALNLDKVDPNFSGFNPFPSLPSVASLTAVFVSSRNALLGRGVA